MLAVLVGLAVSVPGQPNKAANQKEQISQTTKPVVLSPETADKDAHRQTDQPESSSNPPARDTTIKRPRWWTIPDWWLVIVAALTGGVVCLQSVLMYRQVSIFMDKERATLSIQLGEDEFWYSNDPDTAGEEYWQVGFTIRNLGPTRATLVKFEVFTREYRDKKFLREIPSSYIYVPQLIEGNSSTNELTIFPQFNSLDGILKGDATLSLHGCIRYQDIFRKHHKMRFNYVWRTSKQNGKRLAKDFRWEETYEKKNHAT